MRHRGLSLPHAFSIDFPQFEIWNLKFEFSTTDSPDLRTIFFSLSYLNECHKISCRHSYKALVKWWCQCGYEYGDHLFCRGEVEPLRLSRESSLVAWYYISVGRMDQAWFRCWICSETWKYMCGLPTNWLLLYWDKQTKFSLSLSNYSKSSRWWVFSFGIFSHFYSIQMKVGLQMVNPIIFLKSGTWNLGGYSRSAYKYLSEKWTSSVWVSFIYLIWFSSVSILGFTFSAVTSSLRFHGLEQGIRM